MSAGLRHRFSLETNNYGSFNRATTVEQRFNDYSRLLDANNYEELSEFDVNRLNSEQHYGETNFEEYYPSETGNDLNSLSNINDRTPLLEPSSGSSSGGSGVSGISSALPVGNTGLAVTGVALATGIGVGVKELIDRTKKKGYVLPNSEFIGPGNPMPIGAARDKADQIAKSHDSAYEQVYKEVNSDLTEGEQAIYFANLIKKADNVAIQEFLNHYHSEGDFRSLIGAGGLYLKQNLENVFGHIYPKCKYFCFAEMPKKTRPLGPPPDERPNWDSMNEGQRRYAYEQYNLARVRRSLPIDHPIPVPDSSLMNEPSSASENTDIPDSMPPPVTPSPQQKRPAEEQATPATSKASRSGDMVLPGTGENYPVDNATSNNGIVMVPRPFESHHVSYRTYKKVHRFLTFGLAYNGMLLNYEYEIPGTVKDTFVKKTHDNAFMSTPMAYIPWEWDFMYLNPSEFELLPDYCEVVELKMKVSAENIRIAFPTNASTTELATLNQNKFIRFGQALLQNVPTINATFPKFKDGQPMVPETFKTFTREDIEKFMVSLYGRAFDTNSVAATWVSQIPHTQLGLPCPLPHYLMICNDPSYGEGWPCIQSYCHEINADNITGKVISEMSYKPTAGFLKSPPKSIYTGFPNYQKTHVRNIQLATGPIDARGNVTLNRDKAGDFFQATSQHVDRSDYGVVAYGNLIEKSQSSCKGLYEAFSPQTQPSFHIGVQPVPSLTTANLTTQINSFTDSQGYFIVETEMIVKCESDTLRPFAAFENVPPHEEIHKFTGSTFNMEKSMYYGLMQK